METIVRETATKHSLATKSFEAGNSPDSSRSQNENCERCGGIGWIDAITHKAPGVQLDGKPITDHLRGKMKCPLWVAELNGRRWINTFGSEFAPNASLDEFESPEQPVKDFANDMQFGMIILGNVGIGKSYLASALLNNALKTHATVATFASVPEMIREVRDSENGTNNEHKPLLRPSIFDPGVLVLDDLGAEKASEWTEALLYSVVGYRYGRNQPIIVTANCTLETLRDRIGMRTLDRLLGMARGKPVLMEGKSRRWAMQ